MYVVVKKFLVLATLLSLVSFHSVGAAPLEKGDWIARFGVSNVSPNDSSGDLSTIPGAKVSVDSATNVSATVGYMFAQNWAVELLVAIPFTHDINGEGVLSGLGTIAEVTQLPPTVSAQYHFRPQTSLRPYLGLGINYTKFFSEETTSALPAGTSISLDDSWGLAAQAGLDIDVSKNWFVNFDLRYIDIETTATLSGPVSGTVDVQVDPWVFTIAAGTTF